MNSLSLDASSTIMRQVATGPKRYTTLLSIIVDKDALIEAIDLLLSRGHIERVVIGGDSHFQAVAGGHRG